MTTTASLPPAPSAAPTPSARRRWTPAEDDALRLGYRAHGGPVMARRLGRTPKAIRHRACDLGLAAPRPPRWSEEEIDYVRRNLGKKTYAEMARHLGRGKPAVNSLACTLGLPGRRAPWTHREVAILRSLYGTMTYAEMATKGHLPRFTARAISLKAERIGLARTHFKATPEALDRLRSLVLEGHTDADVAKLLGTNDVTVRKYRRQSGLPHNGYGERVRARARRRTRAQLREAGCRSLAELRHLVRRVEAARRGGAR